MKSRIVNILAIVLSVSFVLLPTVVQAADIEITEVMYDLDGSDADREWIEIYNNSGQDIDLDDWHFRENDTNHFINPSTEGGNTILASGAYAVIADDPNAFSNDHSGFSGLLLDSTFSLSNDGEPLAITDPDESVVSSLSYDPADGGNGDGLSLQRHDGQWISAEPTPGQANATTEASVSTDDSDYDSGSGSSGSSGMDIMEPRESAEYSDNYSSQSVGLDAGSDINALAGVHTRFKGRVSGVSEDHPALEASWSFGNADVKDGRDIFYTYDYPGEYVATFSLNYDGDTYSDSITVDVANPNISINDVRAGREGYITLGNQVGRNVDLSGWHLRAGGDTFTLPKNTIHLRGETLTIANKTSGLSGSSAELLFPNGTIATTSEPTNTVNSEAVAHNSSNNSVGGSSANSTETEEPTSTATSNEMSLSDAFATSGQSAAVGTAGGDGLFWRWAGMLTLLIISAIGTIAILARYTRPEDDPQVQAASFDINEM